MRFAKGVISGTESGCGKPEWRAIAAARRTSIFTAPASSPGRPDRPPDRASAQGRETSKVLSRTRWRQTGSFVSRIPPADGDSGAFRQCFLNRYLMFQRASAFSFPYRRALAWASGREIPKTWDRYSCFTFSQPRPP